MDVANAAGILHDLGGIPTKELVFYIAAVAFMVSSGIFAVRRWWRQRSPKIRGAALTGTAQVLSTERAGYRGNEDHRVGLRLKLRVEIPGQHPYDVEVERAVDHIYLPRVQPGSTIPVQVDATNPQIVRIDFSQPTV
jgi:hypothetical protein